MSQAAGSVLSGHEFYENSSMGKQQGAPVQRDVLPRLCPPRLAAPVGSGACRHHRAARDMHGRPGPTRPMLIPKQEDSPSGVNTPVSPPLVTAVPCLKPQLHHPPPVFC